VDRPHVGHFTQVQLEPAFERALDEKVRVVGRVVGRRHLAVAQPVEHAGAVRRAVDEDVRRVRARVVRGGPRDEPVARLAGLADRRVLGHDGHLGAAAGWARGGGC
jgi:hypothetical protein